MDWTWVSCVVGGLLYSRWIPTEPPGKPKALKKKSIQFSKIFAKLIFTLNNRLSVQFSHSVMSDSLWPCGLQHTRLPCPSQLWSWWCHPTISSSVVLFSFLPSMFPSIRIFSNESVLCISCPNYWSFSFSISPSNEYSGLISFRMDWFDFLAVQGTLKSFLQHHSSKVSILQCSAFFIVQLSHPYMITGKTMALTRWTGLLLAMSPLFNMLSRLVVTFFQGASIF